MLRLIQDITSFVLLVLIQVLVLNNIQFFGYINPYIYILFILSLPVRQPRWISLLLAFALGLTIDMFMNTMGLHAFATVLMAFLRNGVIKLFTTIEEGANPTPSFYSFGVGAYVKYAITLTFIHHLSLFWLEAFTLSMFWVIFFKVILSTSVSVLIILGIRSFTKK